VTARPSERLWARTKLAAGARHHKDQGGNFGVIGLLTEQRKARKPVMITQYRVARALVGYLTGLDPSAVGLVQTLLSLIPGHRPSRGGGSSRLSQ